MLLSCQENHVGGKTLAERCETIQRLGFDGVELIGRIFRESLDDYVRFFKGSSIKPTAICAGQRGSVLSPDHQERQRALADIRNMLRFGGEIGCSGFIFVPIFGPPAVPNLSPWKSPVEIENELLLNALTELAPTAEKYGCPILLEPLNRYETHFLNRLDQAAPFCRKVKSRWVRVMADFFHMNIEETDIPAALTKHAKYIGHVHLADSTRGFPGTGHTDFRSGFLALKKAGYSGYMSLEVTKRNIKRAEVELAQTLAFLRKQLKGLR